MADDPREVLERAAREQRDRDERAERDRVDPTAAERRRRYRDLMFGEAMAGTVARWIEYVAVGVGLLLPIALDVTLRRGRGGGLEIAAVAVLAMVLAFTSQAAVEKVAAWFRLQRLRRVRGIDLAAVRELLSENWRTARVVVVLGFERAWDGDPQTAIDAVRRWGHGLETVEFTSPSTLRLVTERLETKYHSPSGRYGTSHTSWNNSKLADHVIAIATRIAPKLAAIVPIASISVDIDGARSEWDEAA